MCRKRCRNCVHRSLCDGRHPCDGFANKSDDIEDEQIAEMIELGRDEYREAWMIYINQYYNLM